MTKEEKRIMCLASLGGMLELYDFGIYATFSIYFASHFFPSDNHYMVIIQTYMVFLLGFILRPLGGLIFSHIGDEFGRKPVLMYTILIMGISSLGIACLPTYTQVGVIAPLLLVLCRLMQGIALGGELPVTYVYIAESLPHKRTVAFGMVMAGIFCGYLFAALINFLLTHILSVTELNQFGWRIPFALGSVLCLLSYKVRKSLRETPLFKEMINKQRFPFLALIRLHGLKVLYGIPISAVQQIFSIVAIIYMPTYLHAILHIDVTTIGNLLPIGLIVTVLITFLAGVWFSRFHDTNKLFLIVMISSLFAIPVSYYFITTNHLFLGYILLMITHGCLAFLAPLYLTTLFPTHIRLSGVAMSYNLGIATFGGLSPILITTLIAKTQMIMLSPVIYLQIFVVLAIIIVLMVSIKKESRVPLNIQSES